MPRVVVEIPNSSSRASIAGLAWFSSFGGSSLPSGTLTLGPHATSRKAFSPDLSLSFKNIGENQSFGGKERDEWRKMLSFPMRTPINTPVKLFIWPMCRSLRKEGKQTKWVQTTNSQQHAFFLLFLARCWGLWPPQKELALSPTSLGERSWRASPFLRFLPFAVTLEE
jgi:hypothetical protein